MRHPPSLFSWIVLLGGLAATGAPASAQAAPAPRTARPDVAFVGNRGQWPAPARFMARTGPMTSWFQRDGWTFTIESARPPADDGDDGSIAGAAVAMRFVDGRHLAGPGGQGRSPGRRHYLGAAGAVHAPAFERLRYRDVWSGVDVVVHSRDGRIEYDLCLAPGADLSAVAIEVDGADALVLEDDGALVLHTAQGPVRQPAPRTWIEHADGRRPIACAYRMVDARTFGFDVPGWDGEGTLVIDPVLRWSTYLGGSNFDYVMDVATDEFGIVTVAGFTTFTGFPTTVGAYDASFNGNRDLFVTRLSSDGSSLLASTYIGGTGSEEPAAIALDGQGGVVVTGYTSSGNFPTTVGAYDRTFNGGGPLLSSDAFALHLDASGGTLLFSTLLGGSSDDSGTAIDIADDGTVVVVGRTASSNFPTTLGAFDRTYNGGGGEVGDTFVTKLAADGKSLVYSTFLGGSANDNCNDLHLDDSGRATLAGWTMSANFPTTPGAFDTVLTGFSEAFVTRLTADGAALQMSTFLGGSGDDNATALWIDDEQRLVVTGTTLSANFPATAGAYADVYGGGAFHGDGFVACLDASGSSLQYASYLGGSADDYPTAVRSDAAGRFIVAGWTASSDFPVTPDAEDSTLGGTADAFVACLDGDELVYSTLLGGDSPDKIMGLGLTSGGELTVAGWTTSEGFPVTAGSYDEVFDGFEGFISDAFVARLELGSGIASVGLFVDVGYELAGYSGQAPEMTWQGSIAPWGSGTVTVAGARPNTFGALFLGLDPGMHPFASGVFVPFPYVTFVGVVTDGSGSVGVPYDWPGNVPSALDFYVQGWFVDASAPAGFSGSNAMQVTTP